MTWYNIGTVAVTTGATVITGTGTEFLANVRVGDAVTIQGSTSIHEVINIASDTQISFQPAYAGAGGTGLAYRIAPIQGYVKDLADQAKELILSFSTAEDLIEQIEEILEQAESLEEYVQQAQAAAAAAEASAQSVAGQSDAAIQAAQDAQDANTAAQGASTSAQGFAQDAAAAVTTANSAVTAAQGYASDAAASVTTANEAVIDAQDAAQRAEDAAASVENPFQGLYPSFAALVAAIPAGQAGWYADVDEGAGVDTVRYLWDVSDSEWQPSGSGTPLTADQIKTLYESNANTNAYTDAEKTKLAGIAAGATVNSTDAELRARSSHTGTQLASTISDFASTVRTTVLTGLAAGTNTPIAAADTLLAALAKLQSQLTAKLDKPASDPSAAGQVLTWNGSSMVWNLPAGSSAFITRQGPSGALTVGQTSIPVTGGLSNKVLGQVVRNGATISEWTVSGDNVVLSNAIVATDEEFVFYVYESFSVANALSVNGKAVDSDKLNGQQAAYYATALRAAAIESLTPKGRAVFSITGTTVTKRSNIGTVINLVRDSIGTYTITVADQTDIYYPVSFTICALSTVSNLDGTLHSKTQTGFKVNMYQYDGAQKDFDQLIIEVG